MCCYHKCKENNLNRFEIFGMLYPMRHTRNIYVVIPQFLIFFSLWALSQTHSGRRGKKRKMSTRIRINPNRCQLREATKPLRGSVSFRLNIGPKRSFINHIITHRRVSYEESIFALHKKCHRPISDILYRPVSSPPTLARSAHPKQFVNTQWKLLTFFLFW